MKVLTLDQLLARRREARAAGKRVVQCHGCFDIVHPGHIRHLRQARALGDLLLVSITADAAIAKGTGRPLIPQELRAENLAELDCVDWVFVENRPTAEALLAEVQPDVYVKGKEYEFNADPRFASERRAVESHGGRVVFSSGDVVFSSTALIAAMENAVDPSHRTLNQLLARPELEGSALLGALARARGQRVLIVAEPRLDTYIFCDRPGVSEESPTLSLRPVDHRHYDAGAAGLARHLAAMGLSPVLVTACAPSDAWEAMRLRLVGEGVDVRTVSPRTPLAESQRFVVGAQKMMKIDLVEPLVLDATEQDQLVALAAHAAGEGAAAVLLADFGQGLFTSRTTPALVKALRRKAGSMVAFVSSGRGLLGSVRHADVLCAAEADLRAHAGNSAEGLTSLVWRLLEETASAAAAVTIPAEGVVAFDRLPSSDSPDDAAWVSRLHSEHIPLLTPIPVDPLGCPEALAAGLVTGLAGGGSLLSGAFLGSIASAVEATRLGHVPVSATDLRKEIARLGAAHLAFTPPELADASAARRASAFA